MKVYLQHRIICVTIITTIQVLNATAYKYSITSSDFPPLYDFDDYDACLNGKTSKFASTYCMVYAEINPQNSSKLWRDISQHNDEYKFHYRRDRLFFGVCMKHCINFPKLLDNIQYNVSKVTNQITQFFDIVHKRPLDLKMRSEYHGLVYNCLNSEFNDKFDLSLKTFIEYCERPGEFVEKDGLEKTLYKFLEIILILNILSSLYDFCLKRKQPVDLQNTNFYKVDPQQPATKISSLDLDKALKPFLLASRLLTTFSIRRNYYRLVEPYTSQLGQDMKYLDGVRALSFTLVVIGHAYFVQYHHVKNPDTFENFAKSSYHLWLTNGTIILEIFHVLSGFLLLMKFKDFFQITVESSFKDCIKTFCKGMLLRFIRFIPSLALFIIVNATFFTRLQDGPFWRHLTEPGRTFSRERWLKNLFSFDNIAESGFPHTWYMTTDWQLFAFYFAIVIAINKYPQYKRKIFTLVGILAVLIPFAISYIYSLEPCYLIAPESFRYTHVIGEESFHKLYTPFYTNLGGYLFGLVCAEIYKTYCHNEDFCKKISRIPIEIFEYVFWICLAIGLCICWLGSVLIFKKPSIWTALYSGLNRNLFLLIVCSAFVLLGMFCKSLPAVKYLSNSTFRLLARLSFQGYIWHFSILYLINGHKREPIYMNHLQHLTLTICLYLLSIALAFLITIFIEYPFHQIVNICCKKETRSKSLHLKS